MARCEKYDRVLKKSSSTITTTDDQRYAEDLNTFYARFDTRDFSREREAVVDKLKNDHGNSIVFSPETKYFFQILM